MTANKFWSAMSGELTGAGGGGTGGDTGGGTTPTGSITIEAVLSGDPFGNAESPGPWPTFELLVNGVVVYGPDDIVADRNGDPTQVTLTFEIPYSRGAIVSLGVRFSNDHGSSPYDPDSDRNLIVLELRVDTTSASPVILQPEDGVFTLTTPRDGGQTAVAADGVIFENGTLTWPDVGGQLGNTNVEITVWGKPTPGDTSEGGPNARFDWRINDTMLGTSNEITGTEAAPQTFTYEFLGGAIQTFGAEFLNYVPGPREMTIVSGKIGDQVLTVGSTFVRTIYNPPGADLVDTGVGLLWRDGNGIWGSQIPTTPPPPSPPPGSPPPPPATTGRELTRAGTQLLFRGSVTRLYGPNFNPWASIADTWSQAEQQASINELTTIKTQWDANLVRIVVAPGIYRYWNDPARNRFWPWLHAVMTETARLEMFAIVDWWTVSQPGGAKADDSFAPSYLQPFYSNSVAEADAFWARAGTELKIYPWCIFHLWDEPFGDWQSIRPTWQQLIYTIRNQGAANIISLPGGNYNRDYRGIGTYTIVDTISPPQFTIGSNEFQSEPQNYTLFHTDSVLGDLDLLYPVMIGGYGWPPDSGSAANPSGAGAAAMQTYLDTVLPAAEGISPWKHSRFATPRALDLNSPGWPDKNVTPTFTPMGNTMRGHRPATLVYNTGDAVSPPPPPPPPPGTQPTRITTLQPVVDLAGQANWYLDSSAGSNGNGSQGSPFNNWGSFIGALQPGQKGAIKSGTTLQGYGAEYGFQINGKANATIGCYGGSVRPVFKNSRIFTSGFAQVSGNVWRVYVGSMPLTTAFAAARVSHATCCLVNGSNWCSWYARNGAGEVGGRADMFYHTNGDLTFNTGGGAPTSVEVPWQDAVYVSGSDGIILQDLDIGHSRGHGLTIAQVSGWTKRRCRIRRIGISGVYVQSKSNALTPGITVEDNKYEEVHAEGLVLGWPGRVRNAFRSTNIRRNWFTKCCIGPPFIFSGTTSQDFYSGAIKFFTENWESATWYNQVDVYDNYFYDIGNIGTPYVYSGNYRYDGVNGYESNQAMGLWTDTVTGHPTLGGVKASNNWFERTWGAGVFIEACPDGGHDTYDNLFINTGTDLQGWTGGVCLGRGTRNQNVYKNTIYSCRFGSIVLQAGGSNITTGDGRSFSEGVQNNKARDNIFQQTNNYPVVLDRTRDGGSSNNFNKNLFNGGAYLFHPNQAWSNPTSYATAQAYANARGGGVTGSVEANAQFVNAAGYDFSLQPSSPAQGAATDSGDLGCV